MSSGPSGASNSHDNHPAVPESLGLMNVARIWSARGPGGLKDTDWYIELESLSETLTCKVPLIKDLELHQEILVTETVPALCAA